MADVTLRESLDLMRSFLRAGHLAEAFALGRHILQFYPKHIETYTVLAQVSLATNDIAGANDLLRRALSSDPENVIALAGMALISEAQDKYDEALWYLERAYEIQPSNDELRGELLRVREQFYGTAPVRVELTPGALARVYARQGQYAQAVNEYRRLLRDESQRYDAQVGLAETLYRSGRTDEAAQVAQTVMADAPYALKPNLILGALWTENAVPEGQQFLQRAHQLDPEHRVARDLLGERFNGAEPPRLPEMGQEPVAPVASPPLTESKPVAAYPRELDTARAALLLSEIERAQAIEPAEEPLVANPAALELETEIGSAAKLAAGALALELAAHALKPKEDPLADGAGVAAAVEPTIDAAAESIPVTPVVAAAAVAAAADPTLDEIAVAEREHADQTKPVAPAPVEKTVRSKGEGISTETIAAAAAALATSIALDKSNQPAPTRRTHSAIPKVRPVIPGNNEKLPSWLYISATPANANASFDALPADQVAPKPTEPDRPDWLVAAVAASESEPVSVNIDDGLPDWLKPAAVVGTAAAVVSAVNKPEETPPIVAADESKIEPVASVETVQADETEPVVSLQAPAIAAAALAGDAMPLEAPPVPEPISTVEDVPRAESQFNPAVPLAVVTAAAIISDRPADEIPTVAIADASVLAESPVVAEASAIAPPTETISVATENATPAAEAIVPAVAAAAVIAESSAVEPTAEQEVAAAEADAQGIEPAAIEPVAAEPIVEERPPTQAQPDSATMLQMARDKRDAGDLKGALDLYERVMHRRPNQIDRVTADLEAIVNAGGAPLSANRLLGEAYAMVGRFKESLVQYRTALGK